MHEDRMTDDLSRARWRKADGDPAKHTPRDALVEALRRVDTGELPVEHVIVCIAQPDADGAAVPAFLQGGPYSVYAQVGLLRMVEALVLEP